MGTKDNNIVDNNKAPKTNPNGMKLITVIPIDRGIFKDELSYFSNNNPGVGSLVSVPVRNRLIKALVVSEKKLAEAKTEIKSQDFSLKKLASLDKEDFLSPTFIKSIQLTANYFASPLGQVLKVFVPQAVLDNLGDSPKSSDTKKTKLKNIDTGTMPDIYILQEPDNERLTYYKSLIRESFAKNESLFFCLPTVHDIDKISTDLKKGIASYFIILHGGLAKKEIIDEWQRAIKSKHPIIILATPLFLSLPRSDISTLIIDKESDHAYQTFTRPFIDIRVFAEIYARTNNWKLVFGDTVLRTETIFRQNKGETIPLSPIKYRAFSEAEQKLISLEKDDKVKEQALLDKELVHSITQALENNERFFLFTTRRGVSGLTICNDCGTILTCDQCRSPLVIHKLPDQTKKYSCHKCGTGYAISDTCPNCHGWRLATLAAGIEELEDEITRQFPHTTIFKIDSDSVKTSKKAVAIIDKFLASPGSILLGTEMSLYYLNEAIENIAVISIDSLFAIPDFRISEKIFGLLMRMREMANKRFIIQTRNPDEKVFNHCLKGNLLDFFREELAERKKYDHHPFSILIKITREGGEKEIAKDMTQIEKIFVAYQPKIYPAFTAKVKNKLRLHALIKQDPKHWPNNQLINLLKSLPPNFIVAVCPEEII